MLLLRKISKIKWMQRDIFNGETVSADAITGCLRTTYNCLSTWKVTEDTIEDGVLAIISASEKADTVDIVLLCSEDLDNEKINQFLMAEYRFTKVLTEVQNILLESLESTKKNNENMSLH